MKDETTNLIIGIYGLFHEQEVTMLDAFIATMSIACSIARSHDMSKESFLQECEECFGDGDKFDPTTMIN